MIWKKYSEPSRAELIIRKWLRDTPSAFRLNTKLSLASAVDEGEEERRLKTGKIEWSREEKSSFVSVEVENLENNSPRENIEVIVLVSDADGNVFASSRTFLEGIEKRSSEKASFTWPFSFPKEPSRIEAFAFERK